MQMVDHVPTEEDRKNGIDPVILFPPAPKTASVQAQAPQQNQPLPPGHAQSRGRMEDVMGAFPVAAQTAGAMAAPYIKEGAKRVAPMLPATGAAIGSRYAPGVWKFPAVAAGSAIGKMGENYIEDRPITQDVGKQAAIDTALQGAGYVKPALGLANKIPYVGRAISGALSHIPVPSPDLLRGGLGGLGVLQQYILQDMENQRRLQNQGLGQPPQ